ncbi:hypothetical protein MKHDV_02742 [Halodesulfovibrio sp. MK-HDV]|nr:hypothetical protein MKHDV_02742 [Halodesulfovibrio sp. MK-HDV]
MFLKKRTSLVSIRRRSKENEKASDGTPPEAFFYDWVGFGARVGLGGRVGLRRVSDGDGLCPPPARGIPLDPV